MKCHRCKLAAAFFKRIFFCPSFKDLCLFFFFFFFFLSGLRSKWSPKSLLFAACTQLVKLKIQQRPNVTQSIIVTNVLRYAAYIWSSLIYNTSDTNETLVRKKLILINARMKTFSHPYMTSERLQVRNNYIRVTTFLKFHVSMPKCV